MRFFPCLLLASLAFAQPSAPVRPVPPPGVEVSAADRKELDAGLAKLRDAMGPLKQNPDWPDVAIFYEAVRYALTYGEFFKAEEIFKAKELLKQGLTRAEELAAGRPSWTRATGLVLRGYVSKIDHSVQPYSIIVPPGFASEPHRRRRLDFWAHGRGETLSEVNFLWDRQRQPGEWVPADAFLVHLYGRYCNANKFAGEVDLSEVLADMKKRYAIDDDRVLIRGFSMGGASTWQFATHHAWKFAAAAPGAGFAETPEFLRIKPDELAKTPDWQKKLWRLYNATDYAANLYNVPVVAYSGEIDGQKQAADIMAKALEAEGMQMTHVIGPKTGHRYHPDSKPIIDAKLDAIAARGRDYYARKVKFVTYTLRYNRMKWILIEGLDQHWERGRVEAEYSPTGFDLKTSGVTAVRLDFGPGGYPLDVAAKPAIRIDGQTIAGPAPFTDRSYSASLIKQNGRWALGTVQGLAKKHGLQGPIDDAFWNSFLMVKPTGTPMDSTIAPWVKAESDRAIHEWRKVFRGDAPVKDDAQVTDADIAANHLVLWGDPSSNKVLARIAGQLPIKWTSVGVTVGARTYPAGHVPLLIYPNPLNPAKYVVLNSGFTFREFDALNNARQVPKLPDWAVVDTATPPDAYAPGKIAAAGFFGEDWKLK